MRTKISFHSPSSATHFCTIVFRPYCHNFPYMKNVLPEVLFACNEVIMEETMQTMLSFLSLKFMSLSMCGRIIKSLFLLSVVLIFDVQQSEILKQHLQHMVQNPGPKWMDYRSKCHGELHLCQITNMFGNSFLFSVCVLHFMSLAQSI